MTTDTPKEPHMNASQSLALPALGVAFAGGTLVGRFFLDTTPYALIVAPKAEGEFSRTAWNESLKNVDGALSVYDGLANTNAMVEAGSELAQRTRALRIGGLDDWYLPSRGEALLAYAATLPEAEAFEADWYWSSTQYSHDSGYAWFQGFGYGDQGYWRKGYKFMARAVRRLPI